MSRISNSSRETREAHESDAASALARGIRTWAASRVSKQLRALPEFPFDRHLLAASHLYRVSRFLYTEGGGKFEARLVSSARTLSSPILLEQRIEYAPIESELFWRANDPIERRNPHALRELKPYISSVFHEQNHRVLWRVLPPAPRSAVGLRRYLNFAEALVIVTDMALGDELGAARAGFLKQLGVIYDPGSAVSAKKLGRRAYRNYLQACMYATYLALEGFDIGLIAKVIAALYPNTPLAGRAVERASNLNQGFIARTNLVWQRKHGQQAMKTLSAKRGKALILAEDPMTNWQQYLFAEKWFDQVEL